MKKIQENREYLKNMPHNKCEYKIWYAKKYKKEVYELDDYDLFCVGKIKEYLKEKVWKGSELQADFFGEGWEDTPPGYEYRIKPQPDYTAEIEALEHKAKENS